MRVTTQPLPEMTEPPKRERSPYMVPWIVTGIGVVVALIASIIVVNVMRGGEEPVAEPTPTQSSEAPAPEPTETDGSDEGDDDGVPSVEVGDTNEMNISQWGVTAQISTKMGSFSYVLENGNDTLLLSSTLIDELPGSCDREQWGFTRSGSNFDVLRPAERCAAAPEVFDEIWGQLAEAAQTID